MACTLTQQDNTGQNFSDCDFSGQDLSGYIFKSCTLTGTNFSKCTFDANTDFTGAIFGKSASNRPTSFAGCNLTTAKFRVPAMFGGASGSRTALANLTNATLPWTLLGSTPAYVDISGASFTNLPADFSRLQLTSVKWNNYNFAGKSLANSHFMNCDLTGCVMTGSVLDYVSFIQVTDLTGVKMNNCSLYHTVFDGSTMTNTDLSYASKIEGCSFLNTLLKGTIFDGNNLTTSKFGVPDLTSTDPNYITSFQYATLSADFMITNLQKKWQCADFRNVIIPDFNTITNQLYNLQAHDSLFNNSLSFQNAKLNGSNFTKATFNGVNFNNAFMNNVNLVGATTANGNVLGRKAAVFIVSQSNANLQAPNDYNSFLDALQQNDLPSITSVFNHYGYKAGDISSTPTTDAVSKNQAWTIVDQQTLPNRTYMVVKSAIPSGSGLELIVYDNTPSSFSYAFMIGDYLETVVFSNAKMDHTQLYGAVITFADLRYVDLTGAQLGENAAVFSLSQTDSSIAAPYDYKSFINALQTSNLSAIVNVFQHYGYTIGNITCTSSVSSTGNATWMITDQLQNPPRHFSIEQNAIKDSPGNYELDVLFTDASPANLDNSYMAGIVLTQANLTACSAEGSHLYNDQMTSSGAVLDRTVLVDVSFVNANLYNADFTSATLDGANFTGANLMNANFKGVNFKAGTGGKAVTFNGANLQGTDFSSSTFNGVIFLNAGICVPINEATPDKTNGVWLHSATNSSDNNFATYIDELNNATSLKVITDPAPSVMSTQLLTTGVIKPPVIAALASPTIGITVDKTSQVSVMEVQTQTWIITDGKDVYLLIKGYDNQFTVCYNVYLTGNPTLKCTLDLATPLSNGTISQSLIDTIKRNSLGSVIISTSATLTNSYGRADAWIIYDPTTMKSYSLWWGSQLSAGVNPKLTNVIFVRTSLSLLPTFFVSFGIGLRFQSTVTRTIDTSANTTTWVLDVGKQDSYYLKTGYIQYKIIGNSATTPTQLDVYGYSMRMSGLGNDQQQIIQDFDCQVTKISADKMDATTLLPNNATKQQNEDLGIPFSKWMRIYQSFPAPPVCVPTGMSYCQRPSPNAESLKALFTADDNQWQLVVPQLKLVL